MTQWTVDNPHVLKMWAYLSQRSNSNNMQDKGWMGWIIHLILSYVHIGVLFFMKEIYFKKREFVFSNVWIISTVFS